MGLGGWARSLASRGRGWGSRGAAGRSLAGRGCGQAWAHPGLPIPALCLQTKELERRILASNPVSVLSSQTLLLRPFAACSVMAVKHPCFSRVHRRCRHGHSQLWDITAGPSPLPREALGPFLCASARAGFAWTGPRCLCSRSASWPAALTESLPLGTVGGTDGVRAQTAF